MISHNSLEKWCKANNREDILKAWDTDKNLPDSPSSLSYACHKKVHWFCTDCGISFERIIRDVTRGKFCLCKKCSIKYRAANTHIDGHKSAETKRKKMIANGNSFANKYPSLAKLWDYERNKPYTPSDYTSGNHFNAYWLCEYGHSYRQQIKNKLRGDGCPVCSRKQAQSRVNDITITHPGVLASWDYEQNTISPEEVLYGSAKKIFWKCGLGHTWKESVADYVKKTEEKCPYCSKRKVLLGFNDIATLYPEYASQWDYTLNDRHPEEFTERHGYLAYWKCENGHGWRRKINARIQDKSGCPECAQYRRTSFPEQAMVYYLEHHGFNVESRNSELGCEADALLPELKTVVEYDGIYFHKKKTNKDAKKDSIFLSAGYRIIRIREKGLPDDPNAINIFTDGSFESLDMALKGLLITLGTKNVDINVNRDYGIIYKRFLLTDNENSIERKYPHLLADWDYEANGETLPGMVSGGSHTLINWKCHVCGHKWIAPADRRAKAGSGCKMCAYNRPTSDIKVRNIDTGDIFTNPSEAAKSVNGNARNISASCSGYNNTAYGYHWEYVDDLKTRRRATNKKVVNVDTGALYDCLDDAAKSCGGNKKLIANCCNGNKKTAYGYRWRYENSEYLNGSKRKWKTKKNKNPDTSK